MLNKYKISLSYKAVSLIFIILLALPLNLISSEPGRRGGQVFKLGAHSRGAGQGGAFAGVSDDVSGIYYNPAGMVDVSHMAIGLTHMNRIAGIRSVDMAFAMPINGGMEALGAAVYYLYTEDPKRDESGNQLGVFNSYNSYIILGYARRVFDNLALGINAKLLMNSLGDFRSSNSGFDIALMYEAGSRLRLGVNLQNIEAGLKLRSDDFLESLPLNLKAGVSYHHKNPDIRLSFDIDYPEDADISIGGGIEYRILKGSPYLALRTGYRFKTENTDLGGLAGFSGGLGLGIDRYTLDYAYTPMGALGNKQHRVSLIIKL